MTDGTPQGNIILYQTEDGQSRIDVTLSGDTVWLTADQMSELFQRNKSTISRHIHNVFESGELKTDSTVAFFATVQNEGNRKVERNIAYYNLDVIISVGYRVNSHCGVQFRIWATQVLREYLVKGFAMNDDLLKRADLPVPERAPVRSGTERKTPDQSQAHHAFDVIRLGFEPKTHSLEGCCSIQLSYRTEP